MTSVLTALALAAMAGAASGANDPNDGSGLPVPRFVSLKSDHVNVRGGPNKDHDVAWVYTRPGLPVEITAEYENWRRIRDWDGAEGWVYHSLLSGKRTAFVAKSKTASAPAATASTAGSSRTACGVSIRTRRWSDRGAKLATRRLQRSRVPRPRKAGSLYPAVLTPRPPA
jgi:SH3-like domain-containing protein